MILLVTSELMDGTEVDKYSLLALMYTYRPKRFLVYIKEYVYIRSCRTKYTSLSVMLVKLERNVGKMRV